MKIVFFEIQGWEISEIKSKLKGHDVKIFSEPLNLDNLDRAKDAEIISVFIYSKINKKIIDKLKKVKLITTRSMGYDHIDVKECKKKKIKVCVVPTYGENTVAEHAFALLLALSRKVHQSYLRKLANDFCIDGLMGFDLQGKTLGVIGAGKIGKHVIRIARGFEMNVLVNDRHEDDFLAEQLGFKYASLVEVLKKSDVISLHVPYSKENHHMIDASSFEKMKKGVILINTARGPLIDSSALLNALDKKIVSGVGLDVIEGENLIREEREILHHEKNRKDLELLAKDHELLRRDNVVFTPHIAFYSKEALEKIIKKTVENILGFKKNGLDKESVVA